MRILTYAKFHWLHGWVAGTLEEYEGPVAYAGGGSEVTNESVPTGPFGPQIPFILSLFNEAAGLYRGGAPQAFPGVDAQGNVAEGGNLTPGINPNIANTQGAIGGLAGQNIDQNQLIQQILQSLGTTAGPGQQLGTALAPGIAGGIGEQLGAGSNPLTDLVGGQSGNVTGAYNQVFGQAPTDTTAPGTQGGQADVIPSLTQILAGGGGQNPFLDQLVQSATRGQVNAFERNVLPGIRSEAGQAGQPGGTRQGIAEGIAAGDLTQSLADITSNIYGSAFNTQANLQGQGVRDVLGAQQGDQSAGLQASGLTNQAFQQYIQSLLQGTGQVGQGLGQGLDLGYGAIGSGVAQGGNIFNQGNALQLQQQLGALGLIPGFEAQSLAQLGGVNQLGLQQYGLDQATIDALAGQYSFNQNSPFNLLSQYQQYITGPYGGTVGQFFGSPNQNIIGPFGGQGYDPGFTIPYNPNINPGQPAPPPTNPQQPPANPQQPAPLPGQPGGPPYTLPNTPFPTGQF